MYSTNTAGDQIVLQQWDCLGIKRVSLRLISIGIKIRVEKGTLVRIL
jgi:hypothetical protein